MPELDRHESAEAIHGHPCPCNFQSPQTTIEMNRVIWKITIFNGKIHYKWPCSIAMLVYQRVSQNHHITCLHLQNPAGFSLSLPRAARTAAPSGMGGTRVPACPTVVSGKWMRETTNQKHMDTQFALHGCAIFILLTCNHWFNSWNGTPPKYNFIGKMMTNQ